MEINEEVIFWSLLADRDPVLWNLVYRAIPFMGRRLLADPDVTAAAKMKWCLPLENVFYTTMDGRPHAWPGPVLESASIDNGGIFMNYGRLHREGGLPAVGLREYGDSGSMTTRDFFMWCERGQLRQYPHTAMRYARYSEDGRECSVISIRIEPEVMTEIRYVVAESRYPTLEFIVRPRSISCRYIEVDSMQGRYNPAKPADDSMIFDDDDLTRGGYDKRHRGYVYTVVGQIIDSIVRNASIEELCSVSVLGPMMRSLVTFTEAACD